ncbi:TIR domain-containing protein [Sphingomonas sp.]|uniref:TIR domain-containing protein n=1 Tax=Sphingomonas sp. TaxID=28214 RepID=UPI00325FA625
MTDIFISYARPNEPLAKQAAEALRTAGYGVWRDDELPAHRAYGEVIEERIKLAKAVLVLWSNDAVRSQWVRAEADAAREAGTLVQLSIDGVLPPMPFNQIQCADLMGWSGDVDAPGWKKVESSIASLVGSVAAPTEQNSDIEPGRNVVVCALPFVNMSGDPEQEYFSDGISEDIITDLSKVSALSVVARNTAFSFKGKPVDTAALARDLGVTHVLEGSVRKAGSRVRISAQLTDCTISLQLWADRYDRDLTDIFAIQDEISKAIVGALKLKLLPKEKKAIEQRGTTNPDAYNFYLLARKQWISGKAGDRRRDEAVVRICKQATKVDPNYAKAWALMALGQSELRFWHGLQEDGMPAAEQALALDPHQPEAICVKARYLQGEGRNEDADRQLAVALEIDPESWEVNKEAAMIAFRQGRVAAAVPYWEKALSLVETDCHSGHMLSCCYMALDDLANLDRIARITIARVEKEVAQDPTNGSAIAMGVGALCAIGDANRARDWIDRAMLMDPENNSMRYNLACSLSIHLHDFETALELLEPYFAQITMTQLRHLDVDPDFKELREVPRYQDMHSAAEARLKAAGQPLFAAGTSTSS